MEGVAQLIVKKSETDIMTEEMILFSKKGLEGSSQINIVNYSYSDEL